MSVLNDENLDGKKTNSIFILKTFIIREYKSKYKPFYTGKPIGLVGLSLRSQNQRCKILDPYPNEHEYCILKKKKCRI